MVLGALSSRGLVAWVCLIRPARFVGLISYALYVVHWPVFIVLDDDRTRLPTAATFVLRVVLSVALAWVSLRTIESWARAGGRRVTRTVVIGTLVAAGLAVAGGASVVAARQGDQATFEAEELEFESARPLRSTQR